MTKCLYWVEIKIIDDDARINVLFFYFLLSFRAHAIRLPTADIEWFIESNPITASAGARTYKLSGCIAGTIRIFARAFAAMLDSGVNSRRL